MAASTSTGCSSEDSCTYECSVENATRCDGQAIQTCLRSGQGCLTWVGTNDCQTSGLFCDASDGQAKCTDECQDLCEAAGDTRCSENEVQSCEISGGGCLAWALVADCSPSGDLCQEGTGDATCVQDCAGEAPAMPGGPVPADGQTGVDAETFEGLEWNDDAAAARYDVYFGACPAPAWPAGEYVSVAAPERTGLVVEERQEYCWRVVAFSPENCRTEGPQWSFSTACTDVVPGPPVVTSGNQSFAPTTSGTYRLTFSEAVEQVEGSLTWTPVTGAGTMGTVTEVNASTYDVSFSGVAAGDTYTLTVGTGVTDVCGNALAAPVAIQITVDVQQGDTCAQPQDVSTAAFPYSLVGTFDWDGTGGSCDPGADNAVFFSYTPAASGIYRFDLSNATSTNAYSRLAVFAGLGCDPYGEELFCQTANGLTISGTMELEGGMPYLVMFYTDGESWTMVNPTITVSHLPHSPGGICSDAVDVSAGAFPYQLSGTYQATPKLGSCVTEGANAVYFLYSPSTTGEYEINLVNRTSTDAFSAVTVYETDACNPHGPEVACMEAVDTTVDVAAELLAGETYLIVFHTNAASYSMVDPEISVGQYVPTAGDTCLRAVSLDGEALPFDLPGDFTRDGTGGSCATVANNMVWFTYTATATGWYDVVATNHATGTVSSRLAVFEGIDCEIRGPEQGCVAATDSGAATALVRLVQGTTYSIVFYTGANSQPMVDPTIDIQEAVGPPAGTYCVEPLDLTGETFPVTTPGTFEVDGPGGTCDTTATNIIYYSFTPSTTGLYQVAVTNATGTFAYSRLAVFEGTTCSPFGQQVACQTSSSKSITVNLDLEGGTTYLLLFYTDGDAYTMVDPTISITELILQPGEACSTAVDITAVSFPYALSGTFSYDFQGGSCATNATNSVFYTYTAPSTNAFRINVVNNTTTSAATRIAVYQGAACNPYGQQVACVTSTSTTGAALVELTGGTTYLIQVYTNGDTYTMVNPWISVEQVNFQPGEACSTAVDISAETFPFVLTGTFDYDFTGGSCATNATNSVFYTYTPAVSDEHRIRVANNTTTSAYTRIAVYEGTGCGPYGQEVACVTSSAKTGSVVVHLSAGTTYLIQVYTNGNSYTMVDPEITVTDVAYAPGESCSTAVDVTSETFPFSMTGTFDWDGLGGTCDTTATNAVFYTYTAPTSGTYQFHALNNTTTYAFSRLAVYEGTGCAPFGTQVLCFTQTDTELTTSASLVGGASYLIQFYTDGDAYTMVDPVLTITAP